MDGLNQLESSGHPYGADLPGSSASTNVVNYTPPVRYNSNIGYEDAFHTVIVSSCLLLFIYFALLTGASSKDLAEHQGNEGHGHCGNHLAPRVTQRNAVVPGPPTRLEYYASVATVSDLSPFSLSFTMSDWVFMIGNV